MVGLESGRPAEGKQHGRCCSGALILVAIEAKGSKGSSIEVRGREQGRRVDNAERNKGSGPTTNGIMSATWDIEGGVAPSLVTRSFGGGSQV